jgi:hypothetical protein
VLEELSVSELVEEEEEVAEEVSKRIWRILSTHFCEPFLITYLERKYRGTFAT